MKILWKYYNCISKLYFSFVSFNPAIRFLFFFFFFFFFFSLDFSPPCIPLSPPSPFFFFSTFQFPHHSRTSLSLLFFNSLSLLFFFFLFFFFYLIPNGERGRKRKNRWVRWLHSAVPSLRSLCRCAFRFAAAARLSPNAAQMVDSLCLFFIYFLFFLAFIVMVWLILRLCFWVVFWLCLSF